jgi:hypothetical protein
MGKTATFSIYILQKLDFSIKGTQALILALTRELARQIQSRDRAWRLRQASLGTSTGYVSGFCPFTALNSLSPHFNKSHFCHWRLVDIVPLYNSPVPIFEKI